MIVYSILNRINGKRYVGITKNSLEHRVRDHLKAKSLVGKALRKYGIQSFDIEIIDQAHDREALCEKEQYWIRFYNCQQPNGYNLTTGGEGTPNPTPELRARLSLAHSGRKASPETRAKMRTSNRSKEVAQRPEWRAAISASNKGRKLSEEHKRKISDIQRGQKRGPYSLERRANMSRAAIAHNAGRRLIESGKCHRWSKGQPAWNKGKNSSAEWRAHLSESHKGLKQSEETKRKRSESLKRAYAEGRKQPLPKGYVPTDPVTGRWVSKLIQ